MSARQITTDSDDQNQHVEDMSNETPVSQLWRSKRFQIFLAMVDAEIAQGAKPLAGGFRWSTGNPFMSWHDLRAPTSTQSCKLRTWVQIHMCRSRDTPTPLTSKG